MIQAFFTYLFESTVCLILFAVFYKLFLQKLTFFNWMRYYLVLSLILSVVLPLIQIPIKNIYNETSINIMSIASDGLKLSKTVENTSNYDLPSLYKPDFWRFVLILGVFCYFLISSIKLIQFARKLRKIMNLISLNNKIKEKDYWIVSIQNNLPAFSFFSYIFLDKHIEQSDENKLRIIKEHETIHIDQKHTLDNLLIEVLLIFFWFNPLIYLYKVYIHEIHEFIVDERLTNKHVNKKEYSNLLLNLAVDNVNISPFLGFSSIQIKKRISMLNKEKSKAMKKTTFIFIIPLIATMLLSFSISEKVENNILKQETAAISKLKIGEITWAGNSAFTSKELTEILGLKSGENYNHDTHNRIMNGGSIQTLYLNNGFVFYKGEFEEKIVKGIVNLNINIYEGNKGEIGNIDLLNNSKYTKEQIIPKLSIQSGDLFSKSKIGESVSIIEKLEGLSSGKININVLPEQNKLTEKGYSIINLEFEIAKN
jgi:beta-lactamase regulating signal transducer with metallopeptidase domain